MNQELLWVLMAVCGYLLGAIPFGIVVSKALGLPDPRTVGNKNVGFTNVLRVSGKKAGILTLLGDMGKGWLLGWVAMQWLADESFIMIVAVMPDLGPTLFHFSGFKSGTGGAGGVGCGGVGCFVGALSFYRTPLVVDLVGSGCNLALFIRRRTGSLRVFTGCGDRKRTETGVFHLFIAGQHADLGQTQGQYRPPLEGD